MDKIKDAFAMILAVSPQAESLSQSVSYWYEGICPETGELLRLPRTQQAEEIARQLMEFLTTWHRNDSSPEGKMYGILLARSNQEDLHILKAFSGLLNGQSELEGWVPPIAGREKVAIAEAITLQQLEAIKQELIMLSEIPERWQYKERSQEYELQLQELRDRHQSSKQQRQIQRSQLLESLTGKELELALQELDRASQQEKIVKRNFKRDRDQHLQPLQQAIAEADAKMQILKQRRRHLSRQLQSQLHDAYVLTNFAGSTRSLRELITTGAMPTGTGDCCAPKLLHYAATHQLQPIAMAEFWWGSPSADGYKIQGEFYGACVERCQPLMGFLLSGTKLIQPSDQLETLEQFSTTNSASSLTVIYEDEQIMAIAKPAGLLSVPGRYLDTQDSVLSRLRCQFGEEYLFYPVHRLDRHTSGILLFARDLDTLRYLQQQFQERQVEKIYEAVLSHRLPEHLGILKIGDRSVIDLPLWGNPENRPRQQVDQQRGKPSVTNFQLIGCEGDRPRIEFVPMTGRTHQLRVHAADVKGLHTTILGDRLYGCTEATDRLHLHARELTFRHPRSQELIHLKIPTPF